MTSRAGRLATGRPQRALVVAGSEGPRSVVFSLGRRFVVAHRKRKVPKQGRAGRLLCKPQKLTANKKSARAASASVWRRLEQRAW